MTATAPVIHLCECGHRFEVHLVPTFPLRIHCLGNLGSGCNCEGFVEDLGRPVESGQEQNLDALVARVRETVGRYGETFGLYNSAGYDIVDGEGRQLTVGDVRRLVDALTARGAA